MLLLIFVLWFTARAVQITFYAVLWSIIAAGWTLAALWRVVRWGWRTYRRHHARRRVERSGPQS